MARTLEPSDLYAFIALYSILLLSLSPPQKKNRRGRTWLLLPAGAESPSYATVTTGPATATSYSRWCTHKHGGDVVWEGVGDDGEAGGDESGGTKRFHDAHRQTDHGERHAVRAALHEPHQHRRIRIETTGNESGVPIQLAQCWFPGLAICSAKI